jgi:hypothetical protein
MIPQNLPSTPSVYCKGMLIPGKKGVILSKISIT